MSKYLIGIDCAAQYENMGMALGCSDESGVEIDQLVSGSRREDVLKTLRDWLRNFRPLVLAFDAPLGWPEVLGGSLFDHQAGSPLAYSSNQLFRRATDDFVKQKVNKRPLDVGADRIARASVTALEVIQDLRDATGNPLPLLMEPGAPNDRGVIEVYPAATLCARGLSEKGYKKKDQSSARGKLIKGLSTCMQFRRPEDEVKAVETDDALDAAICALAAADFLHGNVHRPEDHELAKKEGWIWFFNQSSPSP